MKPTGYYLVDSGGNLNGDILCPECAADCGMPLDNMEPMWSFTEADTPQHCALESCGELLDHTLTTDGLTYVRESLAGPLCVVTEEWRARWGHLL